MSTPTIPPNFNYAKFFGFHSTPAAIVFAVLYAPLLPFFVVKAFTRPTFVYTVLAVFSAVRLVAFVIRAILAGNNSAGQNLNLLIGDEILFGVGFAGLLYSSYSLVLDRNLLQSKSRLPTSSNIFIKLLNNRHIFRASLAVGIVPGIIATTRVSNASHGADSTTRALRYAGTIIILLLTIILVAQAIRLMRTEMRGLSYPTYGPGSALSEEHTTSVYPPTIVPSGSSDASFGQSHGAYILCVVGVLLLVRELFNTVTLNNSKRQNQEQLWYPFVALAELLAVTLFVVPGLVPPRAELAS